MIDTENEGFKLTDSTNGVWFRMFPDAGVTTQVAWTSPQSSNGWLVLDRNGNGLIDDAGEMFGDQTPQPQPLPHQQANGFLALAVFDRRDHGGNGDGWISREDAIFSKLRVWIDRNHDGISQPSELHTLQEIGISAISLDYELSKKTDASGNYFRYKSHLKDMTGGESNKVIYDVFLALGSDQGMATPENQSWPAEPPSVGFAQR